MEYRAHKSKLRKYRAFVDWTIGGERKRKYFTSHETAKGWAADKNRHVLNVGINSAVLSDRLRVQAQEADVMLQPYGKSIIDAVKFAVSHWEVAKNSQKVSHVIKKLLEEKEKMRKQGLRGGSERYCIDLKLRLGRFAKTYGGAKISEITRSQIREWLEGLSGGPANRNNCQRALSVLWEYARHRDWCKGNPVKEIKKSETPASKIEILTVLQTAKLLAGAPPHIVPHLAIGLFCGLRRSELARVGPTSVKLESGLVEVSVTKTKGAARRFVRIRQNLRAWLLGCGPVVDLTPNQFREGLDSAIKESGIKRWPNNAMRHSFCSYALAHDRNLNDLTLEMGHTNPHTIFAHYRELVTPADAAAYWRLTPARAAALSGRP